MKKLFLSLMISVFVLGCGNSNENNLKTAGVIDFEHVINESKVGMQAQLDADAYEQALVDEFIIPRRQILIDLQEDYNKLINNKNTTEAAKNKKSEEFQNAKNEYDSYIQAVNDKLQENNMEISKKLVNDIKEVAGQIAKEKNINFLINSDRVVFTDGIPDITEDVILRLNREFDVN